MKSVVRWAATANGSAIGGLFLSATLLSGSGFAEKFAASWWGLLLASSVAIGSCEVFHWGALAVLRRWNEKEEGKGPT